MWDVFVGAMIVLCLSLGSFYGGVWIVRRCSERVRTGLQFVAVTVLLVFAFLLHGKLLLTRVLPVSNVIVLGNWIPVGAAFLCGLFSDEARIPFWRRKISAGILASMGLCSLLSTAGGTSPPAEDWWNCEGVCLQSADSSCSACCAVMLLNHYGIQSDEPEMVRLCLTDDQGTCALGLYRGLTIKTKGTARKPRAFHETVEGLRRELPAPVILFVRGEYGDGDFNVFAQKAKGWVRSAGIDHAVVVYEITEDGWVVVGDPAVGRCRWNLDQLKARWRGDGLRLVDRGS
jgi:predicted double-glycine peptidase